MPSRTLGDWIRHPSPEREGPLRGSPVIYGSIWSSYQCCSKHCAQKRQVIAAAGKEFGAWPSRVFGSVGRGEECANSGIDFLVDFPPGYDLFAQRMPLAERLAEIIGRQVDLVPEHDLNRHIRPYVLAKAVDL